MPTKYSRMHGKYLAKPIQLKFEKHNFGDIAPATLMFDTLSGYDFLSAMAECLIATGFAKDSMDKVEGELKATKYHLEDMRQLTLRLNLPPAQTKE